MPKSELVGVLGLVGGVVAERRQPLEELVPDGAARFARLVSIAPDLSADAETILALLEPGVWDIPLRQMASMGEILSASRDSARPSRRLAGAALELLRRRRIWLPRWILVTLALVRLGSRRGARALFNWLTTPE